MAVFYRAVRHLGQKHIESSVAQGGPPRVLDGFGTFAIVAGSMLGIGIFLAPPLVAERVGSEWLFIALWVFGGIVALGGAVACGELGAMFPRSGGDYVFQREAFGPSLAFANGWLLFSAVFGGSIAAIAVGLSQYQLPVILGMELGQPVWGGITGIQLIAIMLIFLLTLMNSAGVAISGRFQACVTLIPITVLTLGAIYVVFFWSTPERLAVESTHNPTLSVTGIVAAYLPIYYAFSGWNALIYLGGEVRNPGRTIPRALITGTLAITLLYTLLCVGFTKVLGVAALSQVNEAGSASAEVLGGGSAKYVITCCILIALVACLNGSILGGARVAYAMGRDGVLWRKIGKLDEKRKVPSRALWLQAVWASFLVMSESFTQILDLVSVAMVLCGTITVASLFVLRARRGKEERPYRAWGYPWLPGLYLLVNGAVIVIIVARAFTEENATFYPLLGVLVMTIAYLGHRYVGTRRDTEASL